MSDSNIVLAPDGAFLFRNDIFEVALMKAEEGWLVAHSQSKPLKPMPTLADALAAVSSYLREDNGSPDIAKWEYC